MCKRQRCKQRGIDDGVDGCCSADAQGQRRDDGNGQGRVFAQHAHAIAKILEQISHGTSCLRAAAFKMDQSIFRAKEAGKIGRKDHFLCKESVCLFSFVKPCAIPDNESSLQLDFDFSGTSQD